MEIMGTSLTMAGKGNFLVSGNFVILESAGTNKCDVEDSYPLLQGLTTIRQWTMPPVSLQLLETFSPSE